jgi:DNA modification methylase
VSALVYPGDCRATMETMTATGPMFDSIVTDPPYDLVSVVKRFGSATAAPAQHGTDGLYARQTAGFMGKKWDGTGVAFDPETWRRAYEVLKPGGYLVAFGGTRTYHRMAVAIEDAGFEIRDSIMWLYGTGFPKSHDVSKGIDKAAGAVREVTARRVVSVGFDKESEGGGGWQAGEIVTSTPATPDAAEWRGWGTALKPGYEPIVVARKPLGQGTVAANVLAYRTGGINIDACRIPLAPGDALQAGIIGDYETVNTGVVDSTWGFKHVDRAPGLGRWPANVIHDGSEEVLAAFADYGVSKSTGGAKHSSAKPASKAKGAESAYISYGHVDSGTAARFFYSAKAGAADRAGSRHPTVKPQALMRWLCRLVTPPGGHILDPFAGSGSTLQAALAEGFQVSGCEADAEYVKDIHARLAACGVSDPATSADALAEFLS